MDRDYCRAILRVCVAQLCQNLGWHNTQSTPLELLTNVLERYLLELGKVSHRYSQQFGRTEPNLDDLALTFRHVGIQLGELEDYIRHIEPVAFSQDIIAFPAPKQNNLQFPNPRSREIQQHREDHVNGHLPYMYPGLEEEVEEEKPVASLPLPTIPSETMTSPTTISPSGADKRSWSGSGEGSHTKRSRLSASALPEEAGPSQYEMMSVVMTQNGVLTPTRQGKLPDARTPPPGFRQAIQFYKENRKDDDKSDKKTDKQERGVDKEKHDSLDTPEKQLDRLGRQPKSDRTVERGDRHIKEEKSDHFSERSDTLKENIKREKSFEEEFLNDDDAASGRNVHPKKQMLTKHLKKVAAAAEHAKKQGSPKSGKFYKSGKSKSPRALGGVGKVKSKVKDKVKSNVADDRESWLKDFFPSKPEESKDKALPSVTPLSTAPVSSANSVISPNRQSLSGGITASQMKETLKESKKVKQFEKGSKSVPKTKIIVVHPKTPVSELSKISVGLDEDSTNSCDSPERLVIAEGDVRIKESQKSRKARLAGIDESIDSVIRNSAALADEELKSFSEVKEQDLEITGKQQDVVKKKEKIKPKHLEKIKKKDKIVPSVKSYSSSDSIFASIDSVIRQSSEETDITEPPTVAKIDTPLIVEPEVVPEREQASSVASSVLSSVSHLLPPVPLKTPKRSPGRPRKKPRGKAAAKAKDDITKNILKAQIEKKPSEDHEVEVKPTLPDKMVSPEISVYDFPESPGPPETKKARILSPKSSTSVISPLAEPVVTPVTSVTIVPPAAVLNNGGSSSHTGTEKEKKIKKDKDKKEKKDKDRSKDKEHRKEKKEKRRDKEKKKKNKDKDRERSKDKDRLKDDKFKDTFEAIPGFIPKIKLNIKLGSAPSSSVAVSVSENKMMSPQHEVSVAGSSASSSLIKPSRPEIPKLVIKPIRCESLDIRSPEPATSPAKSPIKMKSPARARSPVKTRSPAQSPSPPSLKLITPVRSPSPPHLDAQISPPSSKMDSPERSPSPPPRSPTPESSPIHKSPTPSPKPPTPPTPRSPTPESVHSPSPSPPPSPPHHSPTPSPPPRTPTPPPPPRTPTPPPRTPTTPPRTPSPTPRTSPPPRTPSPCSPSSSPVHHRSPSQSPSNSKSTPSPTKSSRSSPKSSPVMASPPTPREAARRAAEKVLASRSPATSKGSPGDLSRAVIVETVGTFVDASGQQIWICPACKMPDDGSPMIGCDGCDDWYHWPCVNITEEPPKEQDWFCPRCAAKSKAKGVKGRGRGKGRGRKKKV
ncbi:transcription initiation factor TFIID subunit 3-like [Gigantopelta aegis]|uniref:transcription initiation factor TFIID subunit 3-like n=1 Tax=Gigantopelta aegis TaxID=1735272 RepID=UPI001B88D20A|nr:transcription initiation factor TFIID subunit 3-like [Gigantopelta aegis]